MMDNVSEQPLGISRDVLNNIESSADPIRDLREEIARQKMQMKKIASALVFAMEAMKRMMGNDIRPSLNAEPTTQGQTYSPTRVRTPLPDDMPVQPFSSNSEPMGMNEMHFSEEDLQRLGELLSERIDEIRQTSLLDMSTQSPTEPVSQMPTMSPTTGMWPEQIITTPTPIPDRFNR